jgi:acyl transferase domain-containing protein
MGDKVAFLYAPVGWQRPDMGRQLYEREAVFREALDAAAADLGAAAPDLLAALYPKAKGVYDGVLDGARYAQPALFAVEVALDALLRSRGVAPDAVLGHSLGELAAACSGNGEGAKCGPLSRREAARIVAIRAALMAEHAVEGGMTAVRASAEECAAAIEATAAECWVAAVNAPQSTVLAGRRHGIAAVVARLGRESTRVRATHPDHTPLMDGIGRELARAVRLPDAFPTALEVYSGAAGGRVAAKALRTGAFWRRHATSPVRFTDALKALAAGGVRAFVEVGEGMLCGLGKETLARGVDQEATWAAALARGGDDGKAVAACVAAAPPPPELVACRVESDGPEPAVALKFPRRASLAHLRAFVEKVYGKKIDLVAPATEPALRAAVAAGAVDVRVAATKKRGARAAAPRPQKKSPKLASAATPFFAAPAGEPVLGAAARALRDALPLPSSLPELDFPADSMGGRCLDAWRYRWGQRLGDLWLYVPLPAGTEAKDVRVDVHRARLSVEIRGVVLHAGALWNAGETHGVDVDAAAWVVVRHGCDRFERDATPVLQVELHKKKSAWWKAVWAGHPTIEPWEVPGWREATLGDGYHVSTCGDARLAVF